MKKDKEKKPIPEPATGGGPQISSATLALQLLSKEKEKNKEAEKKESAAEAAKVRCKTCFKEVAPKRLCSGHGGDGGNDSATSDKTSETKSRSCGTGRSAKNK